VICHLPGPLSEERIVGVAFGEIAGHDCPALAEKPKNHLAEKLLSADAPKKLPHDARYLWYGECQAEVAEVAVLIHSVTTDIETSIWSFPVVITTSQINPAVEEGCDQKLWYILPCCRVSP
jgi:hypothetical protein